MTWTRFTLSGLIVVIVAMALGASAALASDPPQYELSFGDTLTPNYLSHTDYTFTDLDGNAHGFEYEGQARSVDVGDRTVLAVRVTLPTDCRVVSWSMKYQEPVGAATFEYRIGQSLALVTRIFETDGIGEINHHTAAGAEGLLMLRAEADWSGDSIALDYLRFECES